MLKLKQINIYFWNLDSLCLMAINLVHYKQNPDVSAQETSMQKSEGPLAESEEA